MSQPQPSPWGGAPTDPAQGGYPAPAAYPGQPAPAGYPAPGQPVPAGYAQPTPPGYPQAAPSGYAQPGQAAPGYAAPPGAYPAPQGAYPAPHGGYPAPSAGQVPQGVLACRFCGSVPAAQAKFRGHQGMLVMMRFLSNEGPFCRDCGLGVFRHMTSRTLVQGWYGYASFVITPFTVLMNLVRRNSVAALPAPQPNPYGPSQPPMDPGPRLLQRPMTWAGLLIPFALVALIAYAASQN